jgi:hypothetical protein
MVLGPHSESAVTVSIASLRRVRHDSGHVLHVLVTDRNLE